MQMYGVIQTVAERQLVESARVYTYRLQTLSGLRQSATEDGECEDGEGIVDRVSKLVRIARHDVVDAMRTELGLLTSARPPRNFNPFDGTELEQWYDPESSGRVSSDN
jgi:hypothetical protein